MRELFPVFTLTSLDPESTRGCWVPNVGLLPPTPLVKDVFASPLVAAALALTQSRDGVRAFRTDEFPDGAVAITFGEILGNRGQLKEVLRAAEQLEDPEPLGDYYVNVLPRSSFPEDRLGFPSPGIHVATWRVPVLQRVQLTAGDARVVARIVGRTLTGLETAEHARADPFTGPFRGGGHHQFFSDSGREAPFRLPRETDTEAALLQAANRGLRWFERSVRQQLSILSASRPRSAGGTGGSLAGWTDRITGAPAAKAATTSVSFRRAVKFIDDHCTQLLTVDEIARVADMSTSHFHAVFRRVMGCSPLRYAAERRLETAERLLVETRLSVGEIAECCGFAEQTSLTRSLRRHRGLTPSALRDGIRVSDRRI